MPGRELIDYCSLALAVLEGEKDAHKILGDLLEESGERGLAQWARSRKGKIRKRLDFVLAILPYQVVVQLACDFVDHLGAVRLTPEGKRLVSATRDLLERKRPTEQWLARTRGLHILTREELMSRVRLPRPIEDCLASLRLLGLKTLTVAWYDRHHEAKAAAHAAKEVQTEACRVARLVREATEVSKRRESPFKAPPVDTTRNDPHELQWQVEHTKRVLQAMLQKGSDGEIPAECRSQ